MAAALECWSSRASSADEDMVEQVLMRSNHRSEAEASGSGSPLPSSSNGSKSGSGPTKDTTYNHNNTSTNAMQKRLQRLSRNVSEALASLKNTLNLESSSSSGGGGGGGGPPSSTSTSTSQQSKVESGGFSKRVVWASVIRSLTQLYPGSQLPDKLVSNIRKHYDSLPLSYAQAGFDMKEVFLHIKLMEQASGDDQPAIVIQEASNELVQAGSLLKLTFACNSSISWAAVSAALDSASICPKKIQIFEKKGFTLGIVLFLVHPEREKMFRLRIETALKSAMKKNRPTVVKLPFGLCGCQEETANARDMLLPEEDCSELHNLRNGFDTSYQRPQLQLPLPTSSYVVSVDEWQTIRSGGNEIEKWILNSDHLEFVDQTGPYSFKGVYKGRRVGIEKLKGCDKGNSYDFELRKDLLELMTCGHRNILQFIGVCIDESHGLCIVTKLMEGGSVHDSLLKNKKLQTKEIIRIAIDVVEGIKFLNDHGVPYRDLNTHRILFDRHGNACLGDMGIVIACKSVGEAMEYETDGYRWLAPEIIAGDPETVTETWMSNVYSFGMVLWEMVTGEAAYSAYSPVQAAVGIAACGLRPDIPKDCPQILKSLMMKCWNNCPSKRPQLSDILSILLQPNSNR